MESERYGRWTILSEWEPIQDLRGWNKPRYLCVCDCGTFKVVRRSALRNKTSESCGCLGREKRQAASFKALKKHDYHGTRVYNIWKGMRQRCSNPNCEGYPQYGGRGIVVSEHWNNFLNFLNDMGEPPEGLSLERVDVNGNYTKENCVWATDFEQAQNKQQYKNNTSGRTGVYFDKKRCNWVAYIRANNRHHKRSGFKTFEDAVKARELLEEEFHGKIKQHGEKGDG